MTRLLNLLANLFPLWVIVCCALALVHPPLFAWFGPYIVPALGLIMLGMGITLSAGDFAEVLRTPRPVLLGVTAQFTIMPLLGWSIATASGLPNEIAVGLILVSCCPGGTASNVVTYIARANLPLSLLMTMCSTFTAILLTPLLTKWLVGERLPVDAWGLFLSTVQVVLLPVLVGLILHHAAPRLVQRVTPVAPLVSVILIALICANIMGRNAEQVQAYGGQLALAVGVLHAGGFALGYLAARLFGYGELVRRTVSIEVGMQNSGLGAALASKHFTNPATGVCLAAVPCAISAAAHSVIGSALAVWWRTRVPASEPSEDANR
ncbi:Sodium Bile acid symporter family protein [Posidoniimonas polymericola]|uniref:Sodium Bile acid symporter family protein n=1 Tax=Posidoniimonas polymericola TaxID=2528002 RepID=A0A5C5YQD7_9BACT|nr:bile acid:sodium symporter family protein [Posidoniimonas polymericola]TWT77144.1 Sodium Bile acid symporter family protein [Posidoniimonas polymericola]